MMMICGVSKLVVLMSRVLTDYDAEYLGLSMLFTLMTLIPVYVPMYRS